MNGYRTVGGSVDSRILGEIGLILDWVKNQGQRLSSEGKPCTIDVLRNLSGRCWHLTAGDRRIDVSNSMMLELLKELGLSDKDDEWTSRLGDKLSILGQVEGASEFKPAYVGLASEGW